MKRKNYLICLLTAIILLPIGVQAKDKKKGKKNIPMTEIQTTGTQDRAIWVKLLWKISYPVIHNLAEGTLHQNMPIETRSGETAGYKDMTHLEAVGRTLAGVAPWLALPDDDTEEGKLRKQMREEVLKGLKKCSRSCITRLTELHQTRSTYRRCRLSGTCLPPRPQSFMGTIG